MGTKSSFDTARAEDHVPALVLKISTALLIRGLFISKKTLTRSTESIILGLRHAASSRTIYLK